MKENLEKSRRLRKEQLGYQAESESLDSHAGDEGRLSIQLVNRFNSESSEVNLKSQSDLQSNWWSSLLNKEPAAAEHTQGVSKLLQGHTDALSFDAIAADKAYGTQQPLNMQQNFEYVEEIEFRGESNHQVVKKADSKDVE